MYRNYIAQMMNYKVNCSGWNDWNARPVMCIPPPQSLQQQSQAAAKRHEALSETTAAYMRLQVEVLGKLNDKLDGHEDRLKKVEEQHKEAEEHGATEEG